MINVIRGIESAIINITKKNHSIKLPKGFPLEALNN
jgi:hypothetical protein